MIKIALKHWIYEKCIDVLFKAIGNNFRLGQEKNKFRIGDRFYVIISSKRTTALWDCTILNNVRGILTVKYCVEKYYCGSTNSIKTVFYDNLIYPYTISTYIADKYY